MTNDEKNPTLSSYDAFANAIAILRGTLDVRWIERCVLAESKVRVHTRLSLSSRSWPKPVVLHSK